MCSYVDLRNILHITRPLFQPVRLRAATHNANAVLLPSTRKRISSETELSRPTSRTSKAEDFPPSQKAWSRVILLKIRPFSQLSLWRASEWELGRGRQADFRNIAHLWWLRGWILWIVNAASGFLNSNAIKLLRWVRPRSATTSTSTTAWLQSSSPSSRN